MFDNHMRINAKKTKEMLIYFGRKFDKDVVTPVTLDSDQIDRADTGSTL